jgi:hypothetical protein
MKGIIALAIIMVCVAQVKSQVNQPVDVAPKIIPPSPEAANLGKFADVPVSLYTGAPNISIPIYTVEAGTLRLPISLEYSASGIKVEEMASWVGIGWALNAGGVVTRTVRGKPDDSDFGFGFFRYSPGKTVQWLLSLSGAAKASAMQEISDGSADAEPDQYFVNVNGTTAKFTYDWNGQVVSDQPNKIRIEKIQDTGSAANPFKILGWDITDESGNIYKFREIETTSTDAAGVIGPTRNGIFASSWFLTQMTDCNGDNAINFLYTPYALDYGFKGNVTIAHAIFGGGPCFTLGAAGYLTQSNSRTAIQGRRISSITSTSGATIEFVSGLSTRLDNQQLEPGGTSTNFFPIDKILIRNSLGQEVMNYKFLMDYSTGKLTLRSVAPGKNGSAISPPFLIDYSSVILPSALSKAQDHWGFFNGQISNAHLVPAEWMSLGYGVGMDEVSFLAGANREASAAHMGAGSIQRIRYPTGGFTEFDFEPHDFGYVQSVPINRYHRDAVTFSANAVEAATGSTFSQTTPLTINANPYDINEKIPVAVNWSVHSDAATAANKASIKLYNVNSPSTPIIAQTLGIDPENPSHVWSGMLTIKLAPGNYVLEASCKKFGAVNDFANISIELNNYNPAILYKFKPAGGLRVKEIRQYEAANDPNFTIRRFNYVMQNEPDRSSGVLYQEPIYGYFHTKACMMGGEQGEQTTQMYTRLSNNAIILGVTQGSHIGYREVETVFVKGLQTNGKIVSKFYSPFEYNDNIFTQLPFRAVESRSFNTGLLREELTYSSSQVPIRKNENSYTAFESNVAGLTAIFQGGLQLEHNYIVGPYLGYFGRRITTLETEVLYPSAGSGSAEISKTKQTTYDSFLSRPTKLESTESDGSKTITEYYYPQDYISPSAEITSLIQKNIITPLETVQKREVGVAQVILSGEHVEYQVSSGKVRLLTKKALRTQNPIASGFTYSKNNSGGFPDTRYQEVLRVTNYDSKGNIISFITNSGINNSYIWGYGGVYPIAEIRNALPTQVYYNGFEENGTLGNCKTGLKAFVGNSFSIPTAERPVGTNLVMSYWYFDGQWKFQTEVPYTPTINPAGASLIDDLKVYPSGATMQTYTYSPGIGITSVTDANNFTTLYEYDLNRLVRIVDHKSDIVKSFKYNYKQ